jgi:hypothetical protein
MTAAEVGEWREPPRSGTTSRYDLYAIAETLRANPGKSQLVMSFTALDPAEAQRGRQAGSNITNGFWAAFTPRRAFRGTTRQEDKVTPVLDENGQPVIGEDGEPVTRTEPVVNVYAVYLGPVDSGRRL